MSECPKCGTFRGGPRCQVCGYENDTKPQVETAEAPQETETAAEKRPARKATTHKR